MDKATLIELMQSEKYSLSLLINKKLMEIVSAEVKTDSRYNSVTALANDLFTGYLVDRGLMEADEKSMYMANLRTRKQG